MSCSGEPQCVYSIFKRLGTELVLGLFLNVRDEDQPKVFQEIMELCTEHWHVILHNSLYQRESRQEAMRNPDHLHRVLLELQRLWPPFIGGLRLAEKESTLADFCAPKDYDAMYVGYFIHCDPEVFQQPDSFLPERWSGRNAGQEHLLCTFGNGPRRCIGSTLTEMFIKEACRCLLKNYDWCLDPPSQDLQYKWLPVSRPANLPSVSFTHLDQTVSE